MKNIKNFIKQIPITYWLIGLIFILILVFAFYTIKSFDELEKVNYKQQEEISILRSSLASTTSLLAQSIEETESSLAQALQQEKQNLENKFNNVENQVGQIGGAVNTLEKLSKTDPELLQKYSKVFFLNEHYVPTRLSDIENKYKYYENRDLEILYNVKPFLEKMLSDALSSGIEIYVASSYRSFSTQESLKGAYTVVYGEGANQFSADQGYSEHQLGTTVDLITTGIGGTLDRFGETKAYQWLLDNAYKYGFILSYPENNGFYIFEPWHWRFVGINLATELHNSGRGFYDLNQRELDEYLVNIFD